ncbi:MAG: efflux RND transporter periplasmic adaptor subunit [Planctomycetota bacterium]|jgi:RND family efflux transporter MFP subunit
MAKKRNIFVSIITQLTVAAVLLGVAGVIFAWLFNTKPQPNVSNDPPQLRRVEVMEGIAVPVRRRWQGFGTASAIDKADIPAEVSTVVIELAPSLMVGETVEKGALVVRLDDTDFELQQQVSSQRIDDLDAQIAQLELQEASWKRRVELAEQDVELAEADYVRVQDAYAKQAARQREVDQLKQRLVAAVRLEVEARGFLDEIAPRRLQLSAQKRVQEALVRVATKNLERCTITSPLSGVIEAVDVDVGESLAPGQRVARVVSLARIEVPLRLPASARAAVTVGDDVVLAAQGAWEHNWTGEVRRIAPADDESTRTMAAYVEVEQDPADPGRLAPGRFVEGTVISQRVQLRYVVPRRSLLGDRLLLVEEGVVRSRQVHVDFHVQGEFKQLGVVAEQWAVLADSLAEGSQIVVNAARSLSEGLRVEAVPLNGASLGEATARSESGVGQ